MSERFHWDGSPKECGEQPGFARARTMWLHRNNASTTLRRDALTRCRYCGLQMEYFDRYDHLRIPMVPKQIPSAAVPARMRWHVMGGIAFPGDNGQMRCFVPHPAFCPMVEHEDDDLSLAEARAVFRKKSEQRIAAGFIPDLRPPRCEEEVAEQHVQDVQDVEGVRHVVAYSSLLWLAPGPVETIQCVAHADSTDERCKKLVWEGEGSWQEVEIPYAPGRAGQQVLWAGTTMWVYGLHALYTAEFNRWMRQRCDSHAPGMSYAPDAVPPQWVHFNALRHDEYILRRRPAGLHVRQESPARLALGPKRTACANTSCRNGSTAPVPEGWLCWQCERGRARRERTHQKWISPPTGHLE